MIITTHYRRGGGETYTTRSHAGTVALVKQLLDHGVKTYGTPIQSITITRGYLKKRKSHGQQARKAHRHLDSRDRGL